MKKLRKIIVAATGVFALTIGVGLTSSLAAGPAAAWNGANLATSATATATSSSVANPVGNLNDGNLGTAYVSDSLTGGSFPVYITLEWATGQSFDTVQIQGWNASGQMPKNWDVQVSTTGSSGWTTVASSGDMAYTSNDSTVENRALSFATVTGMKGMRLKINDGNLLWGHIAIQEVFVNQVAGAAPANLASTATLAATTVNPSFPVANAGDGSTGTIYKSGTVAGGSFPHYVTLTWGTGQSFSVLSFRGANGGGSLPKDWEVQVSTDGSSGWTTVASSDQDEVYTTNDSTLETRSLAFEPVTNTRGVRLKINSAYLTTSAFAIAEIEVRQIRGSLTFDIDQGFGNGISVRNDMVSLQRMLDELQNLKTQYLVYLTLGDMVNLSDDPLDPKKYLFNALDKISENGYQFVLDAMHSHANNLAPCGVETIGDPDSDPFLYLEAEDGFHGATVSTAFLSGVKSQYGAAFAGIRIAETFAQDFTIRKQLDGTWDLDQYDCWDLPSDGYFQKSVVESYIAWAYTNVAFVMWTDPAWFALRPWDNSTAYPVSSLYPSGSQQLHEEDLQEIMDEYPGKVILTFANNESGDVSRNRLSTWQTAVNGFDNELGYGLSDQAWMCQAGEEECPVSELIAWAKSGLTQGQAFVQFEPYWYFFEFPRGSFGYGPDYTLDPTWANRGYATSNFDQLEAALLAAY